MWQVAQCSAKISAPVLGRGVSFTPPGALVASFAEAITSAGTSTPSSSTTTPVQTSDRAAATARGPGGRSSDSRRPPLNAAATTTSPTTMNVMMNASGGDHGREHTGGPTRNGVAGDPAASRRRTA